MENTSTQEPTLDWESYSHQIIERSDDWFWSLGAIVVFTIIIFLIMSNVLMAFIIGLAGFSLYQHERQPADPKLLVKIDKRGVQLNKELYTYEKISSFWVAEAKTDEKGQEKPPSLILHYRRIFVPNIHIPIIGLEPEKVRALMLKYGEEERHVGTFTEEIFDLFGF